MKAVILAAGKGNRLYPLTEDKPKCLLEVKGKTFLHHCLENLRKSGIKDVVIVTGFAAEKIEAEIKRIGYEATLVFNPDFASKNNIVSLCTARDLLEDGFLLINSDVLFHPKILKAVIESKIENFLVVDDTKVLGEEEMKVKLVGGLLKGISKKHNPKESQGEYIGICRFDKKGSSAVFKAISDLLQEQQFDKFYEEAFQRICKTFPIGFVSTKGLAWIEVDNIKDLTYARTTTINEIEKG